MHTWLLIARTHLTRVNDDNLEDMAHFAIKYDMPEVAFEVRALLDDLKVTR